MDWESFEDNIRYIVNNLYDYVALETNEQIFSVIKPTPGTRNRGDFIRQVITDAIEELKPGRNEGSISSPEWRPYYILHKRYIEGLSLNDLASFLSISTRQLRRDHHKALEALTILLWKRYFPDEPQPAIQAEIEEGDQETFEIHQELLDLNDIISGVYTTLKKHFEDNQISVQIDYPQISLNIIADRVILRQILIGLFNELSRTHKVEKINVKILQNQTEAGVEILAETVPGEVSANKEDENILDDLNTWSKKINAHLEDNILWHGKKVVLHRNLWLTRGKQRVILVVDDQEPAINMYRRYLSQTNWKIIGTNQGDQIIPLARQHQPELITLDIMMPQIDGWELLQTLKIDEFTRNIPVIICSAWVDPELARSLGASAYLKKPITQKMFLESIERIGLG